MNYPEITVECPSSINEFLGLSFEHQAIIKEQNQKIAQENTQLIEDQIFIAIDDEAKKVLTELKIKELRYIVDQRVIFPWNERDIAARELYIMGYDVHNHYILEKYNER